ncbi:MAG: hemolysin III family protein [Proteobacteria bacterium]|jgi:hemolysin III|nr:hemolysin III family protein [Pseudomonadota bacterium]
MTPTKPLLRGHFHQAMFFVVLGAGIPLIYNSKGAATMISVAVYILCALMMFGISSLYHRITWSTEARLIWKKLDHAGIYLMIAGTFTPVCTLGLGPESSFNCLVTIWSVALVGMIQSIFFVNLPKLISASLYLIAGYLIIPYVGELRLNIGLGNVWLLVAGGVVYTLGALSYGLKRPVFNPRVFGYHELFHIFVNLGATLHFFVINNILFGK